MLASLRLLSTFAPPYERGGNRIKFWTDIDSYNACYQSDFIATKRKIKKLFFYACKSATSFYLCGLVRKSVTPNKVLVVLCKFLKGQ